MVLTNALKGMCIKMLEIFRNYFSSKFLLWPQNFYHVLLIMLNNYWTKSCQRLLNNNRVKCPGPVLSGRSCPLGTKNLAVYYLEVLQSCIMAQN